MNLDDRPTPETDAALFMVADPDSDNGSYSFECVSTDFARHLERQRDEARAELAAMREAIKEAHESLDALTLVIGLTPIAGNKAALQEAFDASRATLAKLQPFIPNPES